MKGSTWQTSGETQPVRASAVAPSSECTAAQSESEEIQLYPTRYALSAPISNARSWLLLALRRLPTEQGRPTYVSWSTTKGACWSSGIFRRQGRKSCRLQAFGGQGRLALHLRCNQPEPAVFATASGIPTQTLRVSSGLLQEPGSSSKAPPISWPKCCSLPAALAACSPAPPTLHGMPCSPRLIT